MGRRGFEGELEFDVGGGAVGGSEPGAEGVQGSLEQEDERFAAIDGMFEIDRGNDGPGRPEETQEASGLAVKQVVDGGDVGAESFGEILARQPGEVGQGAQAPLLEKVQMPSSKFQIAEPLEEREGEMGKRNEGRGR